MLIFSMVFMILLTLAFDYPFAFASLLLGIAIGLSMEGRFLGDKIDRRITKYVSKNLKEIYKAFFNDWLEGKNYRPFIKLSLVSGLSITVTTHASFHIAIFLSGLSTNFNSLQFAGVTANVFILSLAVITIIIISVIVVTISYFKNKAVAVK